MPNANDAYAMFQGTLGKPPLKLNMGEHLHAIFMSV